MPEKNILDVDAFAASKFPFKIKGKTFFFTRKFFVIGEDFL